MRSYASIVAALWMFAAVSAPAAVRLSITSAPPPAATVAAAYTATFTANGGTVPYKWVVTVGVLPTGLTLHPATGVLSGTPESAGTFQFAVRVQDSAESVDSTAVSLSVQPEPLVISTKSPLPAGVVGLDYPQQVLEATGGTGAYTFSIPASALPAGLTLTSDVIGGTPSLAGTSNVAVTVTDAAGATATAILALTIRPSTNDITLGRASLSFTPGKRCNAAATPSPEHVGVQSSVVSLPLNYSAAAPVPFGSCLSVSGGGGTPDNLSIGLNAVALGLPVGDYLETVVVTCTSAACAGKTQNISVEFVRR